MVSIVVYEIVFFAMLGVIGYFSAVALNRKMKSKKLVVLKDFRNRSAPIQKFYVRADKKNGNRLILYKNLFQPTKSRIEPPFDLSAYTWNKVIYCVKGVTGNPDDENLVPVRIPLIGQISAHEISEELASALQKTYEFYDALKKFHIGDKVLYDNEDKLKHNCIVVKFGYEGMVLKLEGSDRTIVIPDLSELKYVSITEHNPKGQPPSLQDILNVEWALHNFGIIPVDDANAILIQEKDAVLSVNSAILQREVDMANKWMRQLVIIGFVILAMGLAIFFAIISYSAFTFIHGLAPGATATTNAISILPKVS